MAKVTVNGKTWDIPEGAKMPHAALVQYAYINPVRDYTVDYRIGAGKSTRLKAGTTVTISRGMTFIVRPET